MGTISIDRVVYQVTRSGYGARSTLTAVLKNNIPAPNDYKTSVTFYSDEQTSITSDSKEGILPPFGDTEITFNYEGDTHKADIVVGHILVPFIKEDERVVYPG